MNLPPDLVCADDYERHASRLLAPETLAWIAGGAGSETTVAANRTAFARWQILPRLLRDCSAGSTRLQLCGLPLRHPVALAPVGHLGLVHAQAESDSARGAEAAQALMVASTQSTHKLEQIAASSAGPLWFQLYFQRQREHTLDLLQRAHRAGYKAVVVTLDAPIQALSRGAQRARFAVPAELAPGNLRNYRTPAGVLSPDQSTVFQGLMAVAPGWDDLLWLREHTRLPLIAKGIAHPEDALRLREAGVDAMVISNHGGRTLDGAPASLDLLPAIRLALGPDYPLLLDGGVRSGADVFKALALGAQAVLVGRPQAYALAVAGALGVAHLLRLLHEELELCMALAGCATVDQIGRHCLQPTAGS